MPSSVYDKTLTDYLNRIAARDWMDRADLLGISVEADAIRVPFFGKSYRIGDNAICGPDGEAPPHSICVTLCQYLLLSPDDAPKGRRDWVTYKDFKDGAPFVGAFRKNAEMAVARRFSGRSDALTRAADATGGNKPDERLPYDLQRRFDALPRVPLLLVFNDADDEFPATASILFQRRASDFLDMECLAIVGWKLAEMLHKADGSDALSLD